jgi:hypothetical protein
VFPQFCVYNTKHLCVVASLTGTSDLEAKKEGDREEPLLSAAVDRKGFVLNVELVQSKGCVSQYLIANQDLGQDCRTVGTEEPLT